MKRMENVFDSLEQCEDSGFESDCEQHKFNEELTYLVEEMELVYNK